MSPKPIIVLLLLFVLPCMAWATEGPSVATETTATEQVEIEAVSPEEFTGKVSTLINKAYTAASPVTDTVAKLMLAIAGIASLFILFSGMAFFKRIIGAVITIGFGLLLFYGAPYVVGVIKGLAAFAAN